MVGRIVLGLSRSFASLTLSRNLVQNALRAKIQSLGSPAITASYAVKAAATAKAPKKQSAKTTTKKPAAAKKTARKTVAKKKKTKKTAAPKVKKTKSKKVLTDEEKFALKVKEARRLSLPGAPSCQKLSLINVFLGQKNKGNASGSAFKDIHNDYSNLTSEELVALKEEQQIVNTQREVEYKAWISQYTPDDIRKANNARRWLKANNINRVTTMPLKDHRKLVQARNGFIFFAGPQLKGSSDVTKSMKEAAAAWKSMSESEKKPYIDMQVADKKRYQAEKDAISQ